MNNKITKKDKKDASIYLKHISPIQGEIRAIYKCGKCGRLFGRRFIPFGIGAGLTVNACMCQLTSRNVPWIEILRSDP